MCLATGPGIRTERGPVGRAAWRLLGSPVRLFTASALACAVLAPALPARGAGLALAGAAWLLLLGVLLEKLPQWSGKSAVHYGRYAGSAYTIDLGLLLLVVFAGSAPAKLLGLAALVTGSALALAAIREHLRWLPRSRRSVAIAAGWLTHAAALGVVGIGIRLF